MAGAKIFSIPQAADCAPKESESRKTTEISALLTPSEAAVMLRLSSRTLERLRATGSGPCFVKAGRRVLYRRRSLEKWIDRRSFRRTKDAELAVG